MARWSSAGEAPAPDFCVRDSVWNALSGVGSSHQWVERRGLESTNKHVMIASSRETSTLVEDGDHEGKEEPGWRLKRAGKVAAGSSTSFSITSATRSTVAYGSTVFVKRFAPTTNCEVSQVSLLAHGSLLRDTIRPFCGYGPRPRSRTAALRGATLPSESPSSRRGPSPSRGSRPSRSHQR